MYDLGLEEQTELVFREQADGRKVAWLPSGKVALVHYDYMDDVQSGETWKVNLVHKDTFAVAFPIARIHEAIRQGSATQPTLTEEQRLDEVRNLLPFSVQKPLPPVESEEEAVAVEDSRVMEEVEEAPQESTATAVGIQRHSKNPALAISEDDRVAFFVDAANMDSACRDVGYFIDFRKALEHFRGKGVFYGAYYYVADFTTEKDNQQIKFLDYLNHADYVIRPKRVKRIVDRETGEEIFKANVDTEIVVDMLNTADNYDVAYLFSGDSDFERLVDILRSRGKRVYVVTSRNTLSRELSYVADKPIAFLEDNWNALARE